MWQIFMQFACEVILWTNYYLELYFKKDLHM